MAEPDVLRLFIELELPPAMQAALAEVQAACRKRLPGSAVRWVAPDDIHLTLRFLGEVPANRRTVLERVVTEAARRAPGACRMQLAGYGVFPGGRAAPRVIFVGMKDQGDVLAALSKVLDDELAPAGWPSEGRPFRPHLTLARVKPDLRPTQMEALRRGIEALPPIEPQVFTGERLSLVRSDLGGSGSRYSRLCTAAL